MVGWGRSSEDGSYQLMTLKSVLTDCWQVFDEKGKILQETQENRNSHLYSTRALYNVLQRNSPGALMTRDLD